MVDAIDALEVHGSIARTTHASSAHNDQCVGYHSPVAGRMRVRFRVPVDAAIMASPHRRASAPHSRR